MPFNSLRACLDKAEAEGQLVRIKEKVKLEPSFSPISYHFSERNGQTSRKGTGLSQYATWSCWRPQSRLAQNF